MAKDIRRRKKDKSKLLPAQEEAQHSEVPPPANKEDGSPADKDAPLDNTQQGQQNAPGPDGVTFPAADKGKEATKATDQPQEANNRQNPTKPAARDQKRRHDRCMLWFNGIVAGAALAAVIVSFIQWTAMRSQLAQMIADSNSSSKATSDQLTAMDKQGIAMADQAGVMKEQLGQMRTASELDCLRWDRQLDIMERQLAQTKATSESSSLAMADQLSIMKEQGSAMVNQVGVLQEQLAQMRDASDLEYRPWIGYETNKMNPIKAGSGIECSLIFRNTGKTPAFKVWASGGIYLWPPDADIKERLGIGILDKTVALATAHSHPSEMTVAPGATMALEFPCSARTSDQTIEEMRTRGFVLYVICTIIYEDRSGDSHITRCCRTIDPDGKATTQYAQYNDMD